MSSYAEHNWYTLAFDADAVANVIPEDYEYKNGKVWGGADLSHAIEWMRKYNEHDRTLFRVSVSVEAVHIEGVSAPQPCPVKPWHESYGDDKVHMPKGYTDGERTRIIALRVAKDVGAIYGPDAATTVAELFDQHEKAIDTEKMVEAPAENLEAERSDTTVLIRLRDGTRIRSCAMGRTTAHELHSWILSYFPRDDIAVDILQETVVWHGGFEISDETIRQVEDAEQWQREDGTV